MSVGHIARLVEEAGIPTVIIATKAFRPRLEAMMVPRLVVTPYPMGRPLGAPNDVEGQRKALVTALELLENAQEMGMIVETKERYKIHR